MESTINFTSAVSEAKAIALKQQQLFADIHEAHTTLQDIIGADELLVVMKKFNGKTLEGSTVNGKTFKAILQLLKDAGYEDVDGVYKASRYVSGTTYTVGIGVQDGVSVCYDSSLFSRGTL